MNENHFFIIPARGGSKRLPRKNVRLLWGKPLLMHSIEAALGAPVPGNKVVSVSSEDPEILDIARSVKGVQAVVRPPDLAQDHVPTQPVLQHAVRVVEAAQGVPADIIWWMNVSVPQVTAEDLAAGYTFFTENKLNEVTTVNSEGLAYAGVRLMKRSVLFANSLSTHFGVLNRDYLDVHQLEDIEYLEKKRTI
jgi:pseudaminic acid cytidylyltransferase